MRAVLFALVLLLGTSALAFAGTPVPQTTWPMYQYAADNNAVFDARGWDVTWKADVGGKCNGGLAVVGRTIFVESFDKSLYAIDALTGQKKWRAPLVDIAMGSPIVANGLVVVGTGHDEMASDLWEMRRAQGDEIDAFDVATGRNVWRFPTVGENMPTGVYLVGAHTPEYVFSNGDNHAYALQYSTGRLLWQTPTMGINAMSDLATDGSAVYGIAEYSWQRLFEDEGRPSGSPANAWAWTWSINPATGWVNWRAPFGVADGGVTLGMGRVYLQSVQLVEPKGEAAIDRLRAIGWDRLLDEAKWSTHLIALDAATGRSLWEYADEPNTRSSKTSGTFSTTGTIAGNTLYDPLQISRHIGAFDMQTGQLKWKTPTKAPVKMAVVYDDGRLYAGDTDGNFYVIDARTGSIQKTIAFPHPFSPSPPVIVGNTLYVVNGRTLYALRVSDLKKGALSIE